MIRASVMQTTKRKDYIVRRILLVLVLAACCVPAAFSKTPKDLEPVFMDTDFHFSQIDTLCVSPVLDLRSDRTLQVLLDGPPHQSGGISHLSPGDALENVLGRIGYKTSKCNSINATLADLNTPTDAWMKKLDFGESRWLFVTVVEYVYSPEYYLVTGQTYSIVSGYLFEKKSTGVKLVLHDRVTGMDDRLRLGLSPIGSFKKVSDSFRESQCTAAVDDGIVTIFHKFEVRDKKIGSGYVPSVTETESFNVSCDALWIALNDTLKNAEAYEIIQIDSADRMAVFSIQAKVRHLDDAVLKPENGSCSMRVTEPHHESRLSKLDSKSIFERVHTSLSK